MITTSASPVSPDLAVSPSSSPNTPITASPRSTAQGVVRIVAFFSLILLLIVAADLLLDYGFRNIRTSMFGVSNRIVQGTINADVIISGSSRALCHYDSPLLSKKLRKRVFNLGRNGSQTDMQLALLKTYLRHNTKPSVIVHNLDAFSFVTTKEVYDPAQYLPYLDQPHIYDELRRFHPGIWKSRFLPLYGYLVEDLRFQWLIAVRALFGRQPREDLMDGFQPRTRSWSEDFQAFRQNNPNGVNFEIEEYGLSTVEEVARICRDEGIKLVFVYSPEYGEVQQITSNRSQIFEVFRSISKRYSAEFLDYSDWEQSFNREFFQNSQHLNVLGARAFSEDLARRFREQGLIAD